MTTKKGETVTESVNIIVAAGDIFFFTPATDSVWAGQRVIRWRVNMGYTKLHSLTLKQLNSYPITLLAETEKDYEYRVSLNFGENRYVVSAMDTAGIVTESDTLKLVYPRPQKPQPKIVFQSSSDKKKIIITAQANDPQNSTVSFLWENQMTNASELVGIDGRTDESFIIDAPQVPGDYSIKLTATDAEGFSNSTVNFFTIAGDSSVIIPGLSTVPNWVANARIYCLFIKSYTNAGTIQAAMNNLEHIKNMGFNVIWVLPVMDVEGIIDQGTNIGYNIIDFYRVEPAYGTNEDFKAFVRSAHELGLRVILDVTPNHSSRSHSIALDVRSKKKYSRFYDFYQHKTIPHNDNGLGQSVSADGIVYYSGFSDALLNWDWSDAEARQYMIDVYTYWLREYDIDGFRFDVYWGPHRRYGRANFDQPLRAALRAAKADIMLLGETDGTGAGTEVLYADHSGGMDLGYDWNLKNTILTFPAINSLNDRLYNGGFRPGPNSFFLRFLENQDEDRVAYRYNSIEKTIPVSTAIFMATGIPLLYQGQEVGMGFGMGGGRDSRVRSTVNWQNPPARVLAPHYQKLAQIRAQFPAFRRQMEDRNSDGKINSSDATMQPVLKNADGIYSYGRPYPDQNGLVVMNFTGQPKQFDLNLNLSAWAEFSSGFDANRAYYLNNLYFNTSQQKSGSELERLTITLNAYEAVVYTISKNEETVQLPAIAVAIDPQEMTLGIKSFQLFDNYPNPFNGTTTIRYRLSEMTPTQTSIKIVNILGQEIKTLVAEKQSAGDYRVNWDGLDNFGKPVASGVYLYAITSGRYSDVKKLVLIK
jgi:glycosidase